MRYPTKQLKLLAVAVACLAVGVGVSAITSAVASPNSNAAAAHARRSHRHRSVLRRAVHADLVIATKAGFKTVTLDRGSVQSVSGQQLTLVEGTKRATYRTLTLTIPANARVRVNGHPATLADLKSGQRVIVLQGLKRTSVSARTPRV